MSIFKIHYSYILLFSSQILINFNYSIEIIEFANYQSTVPAITVGCQTVAKITFETITAIVHNYHKLATLRTINKCFSTTLLLQNNIPELEFSAILHKNSAILNYCVFCAWLCIIKYCVQHKLLLTAILYFIESIPRNWL